MKEAREAKMWRERIPDMRNNQRTCQELGAGMTYVSTSQEASVPGPESTGQEGRCKKKGKAGGDLVRKGFKGHNRGLTVAPTTQGCRENQMRQL